MSATTTIDARGMIVNKRELAKTFGVSSGIMDGWCSEDIPAIQRGTIGGTPWQFNTAEVFAWVLRNINRLPMGNLPKVYAPEDRHSKYSGSEAYAAQQQARTKLLEFELEEKQRTFVGIEHVRDLAEEELSNVRSSLNALPTRIAHRLTDLSDTKVVEAILKEEVRNVLAEMTLDVKEFAIVD